MARINIEDCWWADLRRSKLAKILGDEYLADAAAVRMWRLAQDFWKNGRGLVPIHIWEHFEFGSACVEAGLAVVQESFVYVRGSSEYLEWVFEQRENARKAGVKSAEVRKEKHGTAQPSGGKGSKLDRKTEQEPNTNRTETERQSTTVQRPSSDVDFQASTSANNTAYSKEKDIKAHQKTERQPNGIRTEVNGTEPSVSGSVSYSESSSSRRDPAAAFFEDGKFGAIEPFASSKVLQAPLKKVPKELQKLWIDQWGDSRWVLKTLEKAFSKRLAAGAGGSEDWASTFTSWLWRERDKPKQQIQQVAIEPTYAISQEQAWDVFQSQLKARGVESLVKLLPGSREAH